MEFALESIAIVTFFDTVFSHKKKVHSTSEFAPAQGGFGDCQNLDPEAQNRKVACAFQSLLIS